MTAESLYERVWDKQSVEAVNTLLKNKELYHQKVNSKSNERFLLKGKISLEHFTNDTRECEVLWGCHFINNLYILAVQSPEGNILHLLCASSPSKAMMKPLLIAEEWLHLTLDNNKPERRRPRWNFIYEGHRPKSSKARRKI